MMAWKRNLGVGLVAIGLLGTGCVTPNPLHPDPNLLTFLRDGQTTKEKVILTLGQPSASLESEKFLTYRLGYQPTEGYYLMERAAVGWMGVKYNLVLVFEPNGVLARHSLVEVH